jgi:hypothetical protein
MSSSISLQERERDLVSERVLTGTSKSRTTIMSKCLPNHKKVRKVIDLHGLFVSIDAPLGIRERGLVDASVANESIDGFSQLPFLEGIAKVMNRLKGIEFAMHGREIVHVKTIELGHGLHFIQITNRTHNVVLARP